MICTNHPKYDVKSEPKDCVTCGRMWARKHARKICANPDCGRAFVWVGDSHIKYCSLQCGYRMRIKPELPVAQQVVHDRELHRARIELASIKARYDVSQKDVARLEGELSTIGSIANKIDTTTIHPHKSEGSEGVIVAPASDWHIEERVKPGAVNGRNKSNLELSRVKVKTYYASLLRLIRLHQQDITIHELIHPLLGDFISNDIHEEFAENNDLQPIEAILEAQNLIASGIEFLLSHSKLKITLPCHSGNHARTTKTIRMSSENGHSLEYFMYHSLAGYFRNEKRVKFLIAEGYHSYMTVFGKVLRFHHGHEVRYQGGVGGIYIPVNKAIAQWNKIRTADLDVFGHFHQLRDGGNFVCNGSLIGFNAFALRIKADFEDPKQALFLIDKNRGFTSKWPVLV